MDTGADKRIWQVNNQKSVAFLYSDDEISEKERKEKKSLLKLHPIK